LLVAHVKDLVS